MALCAASGCGEQFVPTRDWQRYCCSACGKRQGYVMNRERVRERKRARYAANPEQAQEQSRKWREANPERAREQKRAWRAANPERARAADRKPRAVNRERARERHRRWRADNPGTIRANHHRRRARKVNASGAATAAAIAARIAYYGGRCYLCGVPADTIDHVIPLVVGGSNWPGNLRPACRSCNSRKGARKVA